LILGFFLIALIVVGGSVALGQAFVQQRELQDVCDGAAVAAAAGAADLDRADGTDGRSLRFAHAEQAVAAYLRRDPSRRGVRSTVRLSADRERIVLHCTQTRRLPLGSLVGRGTVEHRATSTARAAVFG